MEIIFLDPPCRTVKSVVAARLLPKVRGWKSLEKELEIFIGNKILDWK